MQKVFVYGSLKRGFHNHHFLENSEFLGEIDIVGPFAMANLGSFPGLFLVKDRYNIVSGELYKVDEETFKRLDRLEGWPNFYDRVQIRLDNNEDWAWVYFLKLGKGMARVMDKNSEGKYVWERKNYSGIKISEAK